jgi:hypothetical protein
MKCGQKNPQIMKNDYGQNLLSCRGSQSELDMRDSFAWSTRRGWIMPLILLES